MKPLKRAVVAALVPLVTLISGCDGSPSQKEVEKAFSDALASSPLKFQVISVVKKSCTKMKDENSYDCVLNVDLNSILTGEGKDTTHAKFVKNQSGDWIAILN